jgi:hypothetical protein
MDVGTRHEPQNLKKLLKLPRFASNEDIISHAEKELTKMCGPNTYPAPTNSLNPKALDWKAAEALNNILKLYKGDIESQDPLKRNSLTKLKNNKVEFWDQLRKAEKDLDNFTKPTFKSSADELLDKLDDKIDKLREKTSKAEDKISNTTLETILTKATKCTRIAERVIPDLENGNIRFRDNDIDKDFANDPKYVLRGGNRKEIEKLGREYRANNPRNYSPDERSTLPEFVPIPPEIEQELIAQSDKKTFSSFIAPEAAFVHESQNRANQQNTVTQDPASILSNYQKNSGANFRINKDQFTEYESLRTAADLLKHVAIVDVEETAKSQNTPNARPNIEKAK